MIYGYNEDPYIICASCGRAYKGWESYNEMKDDYAEGPEEVDDPSYYIYKSCTLTECPNCGYYDEVYGVHLPIRYTISSGNKTVFMTPEEIEKPPAPKTPFGRFSLKPSGFSLKAPGQFRLNNVRKGVNGMRKVPRKDSGRRWS